jgi:hypothetical protein
MRVATPKAARASMKPRSTILANPAGFSGDALSSP